MNRADEVRERVSAVAYVGMEVRCHLLLVVDHDAVIVSASLSGDVCLKMRLTRDS